MDGYLEILVKQLISSYFINIIIKKGKYTSKDLTVYEGYFEDDKMTDTPTYKRSSKLSNEIAKIKTRIPSGN
jgi:hypothetical protein